MRKAQLRAQHGVLGLQEVLGAAQGFRIKAWWGSDGIRDRGGKRPG